MSKLDEKTTSLHLLEEEKIQKFRETACKNTVCIKCLRLKKVLRILISFILLGYASPV